MSNISTNLSISTGSASCAGKEDWGETQSVVVEVFDQKVPLILLKHGAGNFAEEGRETSKLSEAIWWNMISANCKDSTEHIY